MNKEKINNLLSDIIAEDAVTAASRGYMDVPGYGSGRGAKHATKLLPLKEAHCEAEPTEKGSFREAYQNAINAFMKCGKVLEEDDFNGTVTGVVYSGIQDMNPAVIVVEVEQENLKISAYAKEGLINQQTAEKAIDKFAGAL